MSRLDFESSRAIASQRWFTAVELDFLLQHYQSLGFSLTQVRETEFPRSGQFFFFPKRNYKSDGYDWVRKKGRETVREDMVRISMNGVHVVTGRYTYSLATPGLCRRTYEHVTNGNSICMVHYRLCPLEEMPKRAAISSAAKVREAQVETDYTSEDILDERLVEELMVCAESMGMSFANEPMITGLLDQSFHGDCPSSDTSVEAIVSHQSPQNSIIDFEPRRHYPCEVGGENQPATAVIVCLASPVSDAEKIFVIFGDNEVKIPAIYLSPYALKCFVPKLQSRHPNRSLHFRIVSSSGANITLPSDYPFAFDIPSPIQLVEYRPTGTFSEDAANSRVDALVFSDFLNSPYAQPSLGKDLSTGYNTDDSLMHRLPSLITKQELPSAMRRNDNNIGISAPSLQLPPLPDAGGLRPTTEHNPQLGMRFVEKLGSVAAVLGGNGGKRDRDDQLSISKSDGVLVSPPKASDLAHAPWSDGWLDDKALNKLSNSELQELVDSFIGTYMGQLVHLASVDSELRQELNLLDQSGFALMHYCSMYDLPDLVETLLLKRSTDVNIRSSDGSTPLHIAAGSGYAAVVHVLLRYGADCALGDGDGLFAEERAEKAGFIDIVNLIKNNGGHEVSPRSLSWSSSSTVLRDKEDPIDYSVPPSHFFHAHGGVSSPTGLRKSSCITDSPEIPHVDQRIDRRSPRIFSSPEHLSTTSSSSTGNINLLQAALSSLSLTDKCALSLSLGPAVSGGNHRGIESMELDVVSTKGLSSDGNKLFKDIDSVFDTQSVLSESDMESLDVAMSMMGPQELDRVESEVKLIQNNVRAWILRKNYTNLRDAARVLQTAWRERKKDSVQDAMHTIRDSAACAANRKKRRTSNPADMMNTRDAIGSHSEYSEFSIKFNLGTDNMYRSPPNSSEKLSSAAATLQAVTRGMLARKTFQNAKRQGMASLIIQKSLVQWWTQSKDPVEKNSTVSRRGGQELP